MGRTASLRLVLALVVAVLGVFPANAEDRYLNLEWHVTYGIRNVLGRPQQVILINGQFPGPPLETITNDNIVLTVVNHLSEPFLLTMNGIKQRKNSWQDGVLGTNCPIPPNEQYTYKFQTKDQIGTFFYCPSTQMHRASGGFGSLNIQQRAVIAIPYTVPEAKFTLLAGDWYLAGDKGLQQILDAGHPLPEPDGVLINGQNGGATFNGDAGKTYMFKISNVGISSSLNLRIQGHKMKLVEVEGIHPIQNVYDSLDVHVGQSFAVLVTLDQESKDYTIVVSTRFTTRVVQATAILRYNNGGGPALALLPPAPPPGFAWSLAQARTFRLNLTANGPRPNPQGSFHYGKVPVTRTLLLANSAPVIDGKLRYAVNGISYVNPPTPLKLADYFKIPGVFSVVSFDVPSSSSQGSPRLATAVEEIPLHEFIEIVFQNNEPTLQSWHVDGYDFWVVGYGSGQWAQEERKSYNLVDAMARHTVQVYPNSWTAILLSLDNQGMWNIRSATWGRQYLGQQLYMKVFSLAKNFAIEYDIPNNALRCGLAAGRH